jgi:hypothetical protein
MFTEISLGKRSSSSACPLSSRSLGNRSSREFGSVGVIYFITFICHVRDLPPESCLTILSLSIIIYEMGQVRFYAIIRTQGTHRGKGLGMVLSTF